MEYLSHPSTPFGVKAIDLRLPSGTKWASCNVGATRPEEAGDFFAWAETQAKDRYQWKNYRHCDGDAKSCHDLSNNICGTAQDVAYAKWGGAWQMPSFGQLWELVSECMYEWTTLNNVIGGRFTGSNGNSIFLPAAGFLAGSRHAELASRGHYWSGTQTPQDYPIKDDSQAFCLYLTSNSNLWYWSKVANFSSRCIGLPVRPVCIY